MDAHVKKKRPLWFRLLRGVLIMALAFALLVAGGLWWLLATPSGATWLVGTALPYAQDNMPPELQLEVDGIEAETLAHIRVARLALADAQGTWFEAEGLALRWTPAALRELRFDAQEITARRIRFIRPPQSEETPAQPLRQQLESLQTTLRQLPDPLQGISLPPLRVEALRVEELAIDMIPLNAALQGKADFTRQPAQLDLQLDSLEGVETHAAATLSGTMQDATLNFNWNEAEGGLLGSLLPLAAPASVEVQVDAHMEGGNLAHTLALRVGEAMLLEGTVDVPLQGDAPLAAALTLTRPSLLAPLAAQQVPIGLQAGLHGNLLTASITTDAYALAEGQTLSQLAVDARVAFEDDPLYAVEAQAAATLIRPDAEPLPLQLALNATGDAQEWQIGALTASAPEMLAEAQGAFDLAEGTAQLAGSASLPQLDATFDAKAANLLETPEGALQLVITALDYPLPAPLDKVVALPLTLTAQTQPADDPLPDVALTLASKNLNGSGMLHPNAAEDDTLATAELQVAGLPVPLTLKADYSAAGKGRVEAKSNNLTASSRYALGENTVTLSGLRLAAGNAIALAGDLTLMTETALAKGAVEGHLRSTRPLLDLGLPMPLVEMENGALALAFSAPRGEQQAAVTLDSGAIALDGQPLGDSLKLEAEATLPPGKPPRLHAALVAERFTAPLAFDKATLDVAGDTGAWEWELAADAPEAGLQAKGNLALAEEILLTVAALEGGWSGEHRFASTQPFTLSYSDTRIALDKMQITLDDEARIEADATLTGNAVDGRLAVDGLPLGTLPLAQLRNMRGELTMHATLAGQADNPHLRLDADIEGLQQNYPQMARLREQPLMVTLRGEVLNGALSAQLSANAPDAESFAAANLAMPLRLSLAPQNLAVEPGNRINAALKADLLLAPFMPLLLPDGIYASGHLIADISADGPLDAPNLTGDIDLHSAQVEILQAGTVIEGLEVKVEARGDRVTLRDGKATDGGDGTLAFGGTLTLAESLPMDITASLDRFVALRHPTATATLSGEARLEGDMTDAELKGEWKVNSAKIIIAPSNGSDVTELDVVEVASLDEPLDMPEEVEEMTEEQREERRRNRPFARNLALAMAIVAENQIFLDGFGLTAELKGAVHVGGSAARPTLGGKMETVRGRWEFFGRTFTITRGEAQLSENNLTAPLINIRAEAQADDILAIAQITGTTSAPKIEFSSIPALPRDEVLSRVMFGENLNSISPYQALQLADMLRSLSGAGGGASLNPLSALQDTLGIDELKINNDSGNNEDVTVGVGKYLQEGVYLEVEGGAGENSGKVSVEVDLTPNISVETEARQSADTAVRLNYKYDY